MCFGVSGQTIYTLIIEKNHKKSQKVGSLLVILSILCTQLIIEIKFGVFEFDYLEEIDKSSQIQAIWF